MSSDRTELQDRCITDPEWAADEIDTLRAKNDRLMALPIALHQWLTEYVGREV